MKTFSVNTDDGPTKEIMWVQFAIDNGNGNYTWKVADTIKKNPATPDPVYAGPTTKEELQQKVWDSAALKNIVAPGVVNTITDASYLFTNAATPTQWYNGSDMPDWEFTSATTCANFNRGNTSTVHGVLNAPNCTSASYAFYGNTKLESVKLNVGTQPITFSYTFQGCTSLTTLDGLPVDDEGYKVIKCSAIPKQMFYNCPKLTGKYKFYVNGDFGYANSAFTCTSASSTLPTTGDLDISLIHTLSTAMSPGPLAQNHPNVHDVYFEGGNTSLGRNLSTQEGPFYNCKNLNKVHYVYTVNHVIDTSSNNLYRNWKGYFVRYTPIRWFIVDWSRAVTQNGLLMENCFYGATKLRNVKSFCKLQANTDPLRRLVVDSGNTMCYGDTNLTQINLLIKPSDSSSFNQAFHNCKLDLPSVQVIAESPAATNVPLTLGISRYKLAYDTNASYFESGEAKYTDDDKILYLNPDGTETTEPNDYNNLNDYITTDPAEGAYPAGGYYAKGALKEALDKLTEKGYVLTVQYN